MKTLVITGGTDGMGRALAQDYLRRGDTVVIVGRDERKARTVPGATFVPADLSLISENRRVIERITDDFPDVDALVLCARYFRATRWETAEGIEGVFALEYVSRYLLSHGLTDSDGAGPRVIVNVSGPGVPAGHIHWDDLMLRRTYTGMEAQFQAGRANDLLGVAYAARHAADGVRTRYVLINPGGVSTGFCGEFDAETAAHVESLKRYGKPVEEGIRPLAARVDNPPGAPLSAYALHRPISLDHAFFDPKDAARLEELTRDLVG
ncbi:SDR family NAD(P)-dependent oxidoreductase [Streptomyces sp. NPDC057137]|uniref:SDR family NAD(P)-dependent oxidoreductase n=1 Tax=Streptomyces sp. NPDC057137 TaxID=3346030 RepID=UPI00362C35C8